MGDRRFPLEEQNKPEGASKIVKLGNINLFPRRRILNNWQGYFTARGQDASPLINKFKTILNDLSWNSVRKISDLFGRFHTQRMKIIRARSEIGLASAIGGSINLFRATLKELMQIMIPRDLREKMAVGVIGSAARGELVPQSDIDFVFVAKKDISSEDLARIGKIYRQTIDVLMVFGFPFEAAAGIFDPEGRITGKTRDHAENRGVQVRSAQDVNYLFGDEKTFGEFKGACVKESRKETRENIRTIFDDLPAEITGLKAAQRYLSFTKHIASLHLKQLFDTTHDAFGGLYKAAVITKKEYHRLRMTLDRVLFLRLNLAPPNETLLSEEKLRDYLSSIARENSPIRQAENHVLLGLTKGSGPVGKEHLLRIITADVEFLESFVDTLKNRLLSDN